VLRAAGQNVVPGRYRGRMSRYRLMPSAAQGAALLGHCAHARYVWNLCVEQESHWRPGRGPMPGFSGRKRGSERRKRVRQAVARLKARSADIRKDWCEKTSTDIAGRFDVIRVEDLKIGNMTRSANGSMEQPGRNVRQKAGLNREIMRSGWGLLVRRLEDKAPGRVEKVHSAHTSQLCSACGHIAASSRESQALFRCVACGYTLNADVNAARNIAAGHAVTARGGVRDAGPANREPQPVLLPIAQERVGIPRLQAREDVKAGTPRTRGRPGPGRCGTRTRPSRSPSGCPWGR
jgi:hypothetical protein